MFDGPGDFGSARMIGYLGLAFAFQIATPVLCGIALLFGLSTRHLRSGKIGTATGTLSLAFYVLTISACLQLAN